MCDIIDNNPIGQIGGAIADPFGVFGEHGLGMDPFNLSTSPEERRMQEHRAQLERQAADYNAWAEQYLNPKRYAEMTQEQADIATRKVGMGYNAIGFAGSGADISGQREADRQVRMAMLDRQMSDRNNINSVQQRYASMLMNLDTQDQNAKNAMWSGLMSAGGTVAGAYFGGPGGAAVGSQVGSSMGPAQQDYIDPFASGPDQGGYGSESQYWAKQNLGMDSYGVQAPSQNYYDPMYGNVSPYGPQPGALQY